MWVSNGPSVLLANSYARITGRGISVSFFSKLFKRGQAVGSIAYTTAFEMVLAGSKAMVAVVAAGLFLWLETTVAFAVLFVIGGLLSLLYTRY